MSSIELGTSTRHESSEIVCASSSARSPGESATTPPTDWSFLDDEVDLWEVDAHGNVVDAVPERKAGRQLDAREASAQGHGKVMVRFIDKEGAILRERPWSKCSTMNTFLLQAAASGLFESLDNDICMRAVAGGASVDLVKDDELDFKDLCELVEGRKPRLEAGESGCGCVDIRLLADLRKAG
jgi:hypothetical protein